MYEVEWTDGAFGDLVTKVSTRSVRAYLVEVVDTALERCHAPWGGVCTHGLWRRGVTECDEGVLRAAEARGPDLDRPSGEGSGGGPSHGGPSHGPSEHPHDFVLVYHRPVPTRLPRYFQMLAVVTNPEFGGGAGLWGLAPPPPVGPPERGRLIRRRGVPRP